MCKNTWKLKIQMDNVLFLILGAGKPINNDKSISLQQIFLNKPTIEHQIKLATESKVDLLFVTGYQDLEIRRSYPDINYIHNEYWQESSSAYSLMVALERFDYTKYSKIIISYSDVLINQVLMTELISSESQEFDVVVNANKPSREVNNRNIESISYRDSSLEFSGVISFTNQSLSNLHAWIKANTVKIKNLNLSSVFMNYTIEKKKHLNIIYAKSNWAHVEHSASISSFILGTKASTLASLYGCLRKSYILPYYVVKVENWKKSRNRELQAIIKHLNTPTLIIRSSSSEEDTDTVTNAGKFLSISNVPMDVESIASAVDKVFESYGNLDNTNKSEVLIQPYQTDLTMVGVAMTRSIPNSGPYVVVEITNGKHTETVTSGKSGDREIWKILKSGREFESDIPPHLIKILDSLVELQAILMTDKLDVEFAIDKNGRVVIFQVRHIVVNDSVQDTSLDRDIVEEVNNASKRLHHFSKNSTNNSSSGYFFSNMSDWNPAEIIGKQPTKLAFDLYQFLVTEANWARQRQETGYSSPKNTKLMVSILGKAFIDVNKSIYSFIPENIENRIKNVILHGALNYLEKNSHLHDKIEFSVIPTCINFELKNFQNKYSYLANLSVDDYHMYLKSLTTVTKNVIEYVLKHKCLIELNDDFKLEKRFVEIPLLRALEHCRDEEVLKFAHFARGAFVATSFMRSAVNRKVLTDERLAEFYESLNNLTSIMMNEAHQVKKGHISYDFFLQKYGHLRPGTYNIESPTYKENPEKFLIPLIENSIQSHNIEFVFTDNERNNLVKNLQEIDIAYDFETFISFVKFAIIGREILKLKFTKTLSYCLDKIIVFGSDLGYSREDLKYIDLDFFIRLGEEVTLPHDLVEEGRYKSKLNSQRHTFYSKIDLPDFISDKTNLKAFRILENQPNFPTNASVTAVLLKVENVDNLDFENIDGKIIAIENADPGYEFLFAKPISGLITAYGGPNSHMSIRCAELNLPAAIGIGPEAFGKLSNGNLIEINSSAEIYRELK